MKNQTRRLVEIKDLSKMLADRIQALAPALFPAGVRDGHEWRIGSLAGEPGKSLGIHLVGQRAGVWSDFASGETGDAFDLVAQALYSGDKAKAVPWACHWLGIDASNGATEPTRPKPPAPAKPDASKDNLRQAALRLWLEARPSLRGSPAEIYLASRGIDLETLGRQPRALRFHPSLWNEESKRKWPGLVAAITLGGKHVATHRTWLRDDGRGKAPINEPKRTLGSYRGGYVSLWRGASGKRISEAPAGDVVAISEGIEDGLSVPMGRPDLRVLCAVSLSNMGSIVLPQAIARVIIMAQNDTNPQAIKGRDRAIRNFIDQGKTVALFLSPVGKDVNDLLRWEGARDDRQ